MASKRKNQFSNDEPTKISKAEINEIKELVNQVENEEFEELNQSTLKKLILSFEKKYLKNQQLRNKYIGEPEKFMDSEIDLDEEIKKLQIIATSPELYKLFVSLGSIVSLGSLIIHENSDISIAVIDLFNELIEAEDAEQDSELSLYQSFIKNKVAETLVDNLARLDVTVEEENQAIHNTFSIFESMLSLGGPESAKLLSSKSSLFKYLLQYITEESTPIAIRLYSSELLSTIFLNDQQSKSIFTNSKKYNGIEKVLIVLSSYVKRQPDSLQETEFVENLFSCLCSLLLNDNQQKQLFLDYEGIQLMLIFIKKKTQQRGSSLKVLDYCCSDFKVANDLFVKELGLKTLFSSLMKKIKSKHNKKVFNESQDQEHIVSILYSLLRNLEKGSDNFNRLMVKFTENNFEKLDKLLELHYKYFKKVQLAENKQQKTKQQQEDEEDSDDEDEEDKILLKRLDAGLFTLQYIDLILVFLSNESQDIKNKLFIGGNENQDLKNEIKSILIEYIETLATDKNDEIKFIKSLIDS